VTTTKTKKNLKRASRNKYRRTTKESIFKPSITMYRIREISYDSVENRPAASILIPAEELSQARDYVKARYLDYMNLLRTHHPSTIVRTIVDSVPTSSPVQFARAFDDIPCDLYHTPAGVQIMISIPTLTGYKTEVVLDIFNIDCRMCDPDEPTEDPLCPCKNPVCDSMCGIQPCGQCADNCVCGVWARYSL
jgi:hypothetical protein